MNYVTLFFFLYAHTYSFVHTADKFTLLIKSLCTMIYRTMHTSLSHSVAYIHVCGKQWYFK